MGADGSAQTNLTNNATSDDSPTWSPDGAKIAFRSHRDGNAEVYAMNANGTAQTRLTNNTATDSHPAWSPDGTIALVAVRAVVQARRTAYECALTCANDHST